MTRRVGLTGGIASGKSSVAGRLRHHGLLVLDADLVVRALYRPGAAGARAVAERFGVQFLDDEGGVHRARLAAHVFSDRVALEALNALIHPLVLAEQAAWYSALERAQTRIGVVEATLLVETGGRDRFEILVTVSAPEELRLARAASRDPGIDVEELRARMRGQISDAERERVADVVIHNDGDRAALVSAADDLASRLRTGGL
jgi:dephospho-CoA kinase